MTTNPDSTPPAPFALPLRIKARTPGEWKILRNGNKPPKINVAGKPGFIAIMGYPYEGDREANAEYIVRCANALPGLVAALEGLLSEMVNPVHVHHRNKYAEYQISPESIAEARAALKLAEAQP